MEAEEQSAAGARVACDVNGRSWGFYDRFTAWAYARWTWWYDEWHIDPGWCWFDLPETRQQGWTRAQRPVLPGPGAQGS